MTLAIWDITTITSTAANTHFGLASRWEEIPDMYPPIGFMFTSTTPGARAQRSSYGLYIEYICTTIAPKVPSGKPIYMALRARAYQKGTRWFIVDAMLKDADLANIKPQRTNSLKRLILYYRAMDEYGETPA